MLERIAPHFSWEFRFQNRLVLWEFLKLPGYAEAVMLVEQNANVALAVEITGVRK